MSASSIRKNFVRSTVTVLTFALAAPAFAGGKTTGYVPAQAPTSPAGCQLPQGAFSPSDLLSPAIKAAIKDASDKRAEQRKPKPIPSVKYYRFPDFRTVQQIARENAEKAAEKKARAEAAAAKQAAAEAAKASKKAAAEAAKAAAKPQHPTTTPAATGATGTKAATP